LTLKFLTDTQTNAVVVDMLRKLGWDVETVYQHKREAVKDDADHVAYARSIERVFATFDKLRGTVGYQVAEEIKKNGGKVLAVGGGPEQLPERAVGRMLFHYPDWHPFLERNDGKADIRDLKHDCKLTRRLDMVATVEVSPQPNFDPYLQERPGRCPAGDGDGRMRRAGPSILVSDAAASEGA
jgi:hypothetical protein